MKPECVDLAMELLEKVILCECAKPPIEAILETLPPEVREKAVAEYQKLKAEAKPSKRKEPSKYPSPPERELPGLWGEAYFEGKKYDSPGALAKELGILTRGAKDMVVAFERAGFEVRGDGEEIEKGKTGFVIKRVSPTPEKYKLKEEEAEFVAPGRLVAPLKPARKIEEPSKYPSPWSKTATGYIDTEGKVVPPEIVRKAFRRE